MEVWHEQEALLDANGIPTEMNIGATMDDIQEALGSPIPIEEFENAWADSDNHIVEAGFQLAAV